jgi:hypothetical protein
MNKAAGHDETLQELWAIKDETATRFRTAQDYFAHLGLKQAQLRPPKPERTTKAAKGAGHALQHSPP